MLITCFLPRSILHHLHFVVGARVDREVARGPDGPGDGIRAAGDRSGQGWPRRGRCGDGGPPVCGLLHEQRPAALRRISAAPQTRPTHSPRPGTDPLLLFICRGRQKGLWVGVGGQAAAPRGQEGGRPSQVEDRFRPREGGACFFVYLYFYSVIWDAIHSKRLNVLSLSKYLSILILKVLIIGYR